MAQKKLNEYPVLIVTLNSAFIAMGSPPQ